MYYTGWFAHYWTILVKLGWIPPGHGVWSSLHVVGFGKILLRIFASICKTFFDINCKNVLLGQSPKAIEIKTKINQWDLIKLRSFCTKKETNKQTKNEKKTYRMGENSTNDATKKGFVSKIYKQLIQLNNKKQTTQSKMGRKPKWKFLQRHTDFQ